MVMMTKFYPSKPILKINYNTKRKSNNTLIKKIDNIQIKKIQLSKQKPI